MDFRVELSGGGHRRDSRGFVQQHRETYQKLLAYGTAKEFSRLHHNRDREQFAEKCINQGCLLSVLMPFLEYFFHDYLGRDQKYYFFGLILPRFIEKHSDKLSKEEMIAEIHTFYQHFNEPDLYLILCRHDLRLFEAYFDKHDITIPIWTLAKFVIAVLGWKGPEGSEETIHDEYKRELVKKMTSEEGGYLDHPSFILQALDAYILYDQYELIEYSIEKFPSLLHDYNVLQKLHRYPKFTMRLYQGLLHQFYEEKKYDSKFDGKNHIQFLLHTRDQKECIDYMKLMNLDYYIKMIPETVELKLMEVLNHIFQEISHLDAGYFTSEHIVQVCRFSTLRYEEEDYIKLEEVLRRYEVVGWEKVVVRREVKAMKDDRCGICLEGMNEDKVVECGQCGTGFHMTCLRTFVLSKKKKNYAEYLPGMGFGGDEDDESDLEDGEEEEEEEEDDDEEEGVEYLGEVDLESEPESESDFEEDHEKRKHGEKRDTFLFSNSLHKTKCCYCSSYFQ